MLGGGSGDSLWEFVTPSTVCCLRIELWLSWLAHSLAKSSQGSQECILLYFQEDLKTWRLSQWQLWKIQSIKALLMQSHLLCTSTAVSPQCTRLTPNWQPHEPCVLGPVLLKRSQSNMTSQHMGLPGACCSDGSRPHFTVVAWSKGLGNDFRNKPNRKLFQLFHSQFFLDHIFEGKVSRLFFLLIWIEEKHTFHLLLGLQILIKQTRAHYKININLATMPPGGTQKGHSKKFKQFSCCKDMILITDTIN